ncbi:SurA N-terminal domain-containing protein [Alphaproteobacteria bacterium]|nr:SurA N-terminal domain-containing protein [Alphaproteobacteria bacterium]
MLDSIRSGIGSVLIKILLGLLILSFGLWGIGDIFVFRGNKSILASVGKVEINESDFFKEYSKNLNQISQQIGKEITPEEGKNLGLVLRTLNILITNAVFKQENEKLQLGVSDKKLREIVFSITSFKDNTGQFNKFAFDRYLSINNQSEEEFLEEIKKELKREQIFTAISSGVIVPKSIEKKLFQFREEKRIVKALILPEAFFKKVQILSESEKNAKIKEFYNSNKKNYISPEYREIYWVDISPEVLQNEIEVSLDEAKTYYENNQSSYLTSEKRQVLQLLFENENDAISIKKEINESNSLDLSNLQSEKIINKDAIELGMLSWSDLPESLANHVFDLNQKTWSDPIESNLGWHLFFIPEIIKESIMPFKDLEETIVSSIKKEKSLDIIFELSNKFEDELAGGNSFKDSASSIGMKVRGPLLLDIMGKNKFGDKINNINIISNLNKVFSLKNENISEPIDNEDGGLTFIKVNKIIASKTQEFIDVRQQAEKDLFASMQKEENLIIGEKIAKKINNNFTIEKSADQKNLKIILSKPFTRNSSNSEQNPYLTKELTDKIFKSKLLGIEFAQNRNKEFVITQLVQIIKPTYEVKSTNIIRHKENLKNSLANDLISQYQKNIFKKYKISINQQNIKNLDLTKVLSGRF